MSMIERIKFLAKKRDKSIRQVAFDIGVSENYLYKLGRLCCEPWVRL